MDPEVVSYLVTVLETSGQKERLFYQLITEVLFQHHEQDSFLGSQHKPAAKSSFAYVSVYFLSFMLCADKCY